MGVALQVQRDDGVVASQPLCAPRLLALLSTQLPRWRGRCGSVVHHRLMVLGDRSIDGCGGLAEGCPPAPEHTLEQFARVGHEMEAIGNLDRLGRPLAAAVSIGAGTIAADHVDTGVLT